MTAPFWAQYKIKTDKTTVSPKKEKQSDKPFVQSQRSRQRHRDVNLVDSLLYGKAPRSPKVNIPVHEDNVHNYDGKR